MLFTQRKSPNWLLQGLIIFSMGIHVLIFLHIEGIYRTNALSYIEFTLNELSRPSDRSIPRPPLKPKTIPQLSSVDHKPYRAHGPTSHFRPMKIEYNKEAFDQNIVESIDVAEDIKTVDATRISEWTPPVRSGTGDGDYATPMSYFDMIRLRIETKKRYPEKARRKGLEGKVVVGFSIMSDGTVKDTKVIEGAYYQIFNDAAVQAVRDASPFPVPPRRLFGEKVPVRITMVFELT